MMCDLDIVKNFYMIRDKLFLLLLVFILSSCGTARGVLYGTGTILEGMATDARTVGNWIK